MNLSAFRMCLVLEFMKGNTNWRPSMGQKRLQIIWNTSFHPLFVEKIWMSLYCTYQRSVLHLCDGQFQFRAIEFLILNYSFQFYETDFIKLVSSVFDSPKSYHKSINNLLPELHPVTTLLIGQNKLVISY